MPIYTYRREDGSTFDIRQKFLDDPLQTCPTTGQGVVRVVQPAGIIFKGGFYVTDNKSANNPAKPSAAKAENGNGASTEESKSSETSSETKSESSTSKVSEAAAD